MLFDFLLGGLMQRLGGVGRVSKLAGLGRVVRRRCPPALVGDGKVEDSIKPPR